MSSIEPRLLQPIVFVYGWDGVGVGHSDCFIFLLFYPKGQNLRAAI